MRYFIKKLQLIAAFFFLGLLTTHANDFDESLLTYNNDLQAINASVLHPTSGKAHFFVGQFFHQYNPVTDKLDKMGRIGKDGWYGVTKNVNAVLIHPQNKKAYFFTGNTYQRYDFSKKKVDKTGVTGQDGWTGIEGPIDAVIMHPTNNCAYFFKGKKYYRFSFAKDKMDKVGTIGVGGWKGLPANIDSAIMHPNGKAYFFAGDKYYRYVFGRSVDKTGIIGRNGWKGLFHKIDGGVENKRGVYFLKESSVMTISDYNKNFIAKKVITLSNQKSSDNNLDLLKKGVNFIVSKFSPTVDKVNKTKLGYESYKGVPKGINAAIQHPSNKKYYFFKGSKYYRYDTSKQVVDKVGVIGKDGWKGLPANIDAAVVSGNNIYFYKGTKYYTHSLVSDKVVETGSISSRFKGVPDYLDAAYSYKNSSGAKFQLLIKKDAIYIYSEAKRKVVSWDLLHQGLFK